MGRKIIVKSKEIFINPYTFIPLQKKCSKNNNFEELRIQKGLLTGWMECSLITKTPIFIPNISNDNRFNFETKDGKTIKNYDFFSYEDLQENKDTNSAPPKYPVIPPSELRGMIRSSFELLTNSCFSNIDHEKKLYKRVTKPGDPGQVVHIKDEKWKIVPCIKYRIDKFKYRDEITGFKEGQLIRFRANAKKYFTGFDNNGIQGLFHQGEHINRKRNESIFVPMKDKPTIKINTKTIENLLENINMYRNERINLAFKKGEHTGYGKIKADKVKDLDGALIYYKRYNEKIYLGPAAIGREVFYNNLTTILKDYVPCSSLKQLCTACMLFGFTGIDDQLASRVRFTPALA